MLKKRALDCVSAAVICAIARLTRYKKEHNRQRLSTEYVTPHLIGSASKNQRIRCWILGLPAKKGSPTRRE
jgi:hypothetical protein